MDNEKKYTSTIRLYKNRPVHNQAYKYLMQRNKDIFKSNDDFIAEAIIYFSRYLKKEREEEKIQEISDYFGSRDNPMFEMVRSAIEEVFDKKLMELKKMDITAVPENDETIVQEIECTDRDKKFASFYDYA